VRSRVAKSVVLAVLLAFVLTGTASAFANGPNGGDGFGTHDWVLHEANRLACLQGYNFANMAIAEPMTDDPDTVSHDTWYHVYDVWGSTYGDAPTKVRSLYGKALGRLRAGDAAGASRMIGLLSHYYADICNPLHTDQIPAEEAMHSPYEDAVELRTDRVGENRAWVSFDGCQRVWDVSYKTKKAAEKAHADYATLVQSFNASGFNATVDTITRRALNLAVNGLTDILISLKNEAGALP